MLEVEVSPSTMAALRRLGLLRGPGWRVEAETGPETIRAMVTEGTAKGLTVITPSGRKVVLSGDPRQLDQLGLARLRLVKHSAGPSPADSEAAIRAEAGEAPKIAESLGIPDRPKIRESLRIQDYPKIPETCGLKEPPKPPNSPKIANYQEMSDPAKLLELLGYPVPPQFQDHHKPRNSLRKLERPAPTAVERRPVPEPGPKPVPEPGPEPEPRPGRGPRPR
jgi:hypothetical protein